MVHTKGKRSFSISRETQEQIAFMDWVRLNPKLQPFIIHIANERQCSPQRGAMLKRMGVKAGVPDIFMMMPSKLYHGLWIELKIHPNKPSQKQLEFIENARLQGYAAIVCYSADKAIAAVQRYSENFIVE